MIVVLNLAKSLLVKGALVKPRPCTRIDNKGGANNADAV